MPILFRLCLLVVVLGYAESVCQTCYKKVTSKSYYSYSCGWFGWSRCQSSKTIYKPESYSCLCSVDGHWTPWSTTITWRNDCSTTCGPGVETGFKTRTCTNPRPQNGGKDCTGPNKLEQNRECKTADCPPVDGKWSDFSAVTWSGVCSSTCGYGIESGTKTRTCTNPPPSYGGQNCVGSSTATETRQCKLRECPIDGQWSDFSAVAWNKYCSTTCDFGIETGIRTRTCTNPAPAHGGNDCVGSPTKSETRQCKIRECPIDGGWSAYSDFTDWGSCSVTCDVGTQIRTRDRTCTNPAPAFGGRNCQGDARDTESRSCDMKKCPDDICKEVGNGLEAHLQDCQKYLSCKDDLTTVLDCSVGLVWDPSLENCVFPEEGKTCMPSTQSNNPDIDGTCSENGEILACLTNCHKFYQCDGLTPIEKTCENGLAWNAEISNCDNPENVELCKTTNPEDLVIQIEGINVTCTENGQIFPVTTDCHKFYQCDNKIPKEMTCQNNLAWNPVISNCDDPKNVELCKITDPEDPPQEGEFVCTSLNGYFPDPQDCHKYYWCVNGEKYPMSCAPGTYFDESACSLGDCPAR